MHALFQGVQPVFTNSMHKTTTEPGTQHPGPGGGHEPGRTVEEGSGTRYNIRSFRNPAYELCREVIFDTESTGLMKLEKDVAHFIVQSYSESDWTFVERGASCAAQSTTNTTLIMARGSYPFGVIQITGQRGVHGTTGPSSELRTTMEARGNTHPEYSAASLVSMWLRMG